MCLDGKSKSDISKAAESVSGFVGYRALIQQHSNAPGACRVPAAVSRAFQCVLNYLALVKS